VLVFSQDNFSGASGEGGGLCRQIALLGDESDLLSFRDVSG